MNRRKLLKAGLTGGLAGAALAAANTTAFAAETDKPAFVLVHGAWHGAWT